MHEGRVNDRSKRLNRDCRERKGLGEIVILRRGGMKARTRETNGERGEGRLRAKKVEREGGSLGGGEFSVLFEV